MKLKILILLALCHSKSYSQNTIEESYDDSVKCYFDNNTSDSLIIYESIDGKVKETLKISEENEKNQWHLITITKTKNDWAQIEDIIFFDLYSRQKKLDSINKERSSNKGKWIKIKNLKINIADMSLPDSLGVPFYQKPDLNSELVCKSGKFLKLELVDIDGSWAKVSFTQNEIKYTGWIERKNQCIHPWTSCPFNP